MSVSAANSGGITGHSEVLTCLMNAPTGNGHHPLPARFGGTANLRYGAILRRKNHAEIVSVLPGISRLPLFAGLHDLLGAAIEKLDSADLASPDHLNWRSSHLALRKVLKIKH